MLRIAISPEFSVSQRVGERARSRDIDLFAAELWARDGAHDEPPPMSFT
jgi:hypothetical protein